MYVCVCNCIAADINDDKMQVNFVCVDMFTGRIIIFKVKSIRKRWGGNDKNVADRGGDTNVVVQIR